MLNEGKPLEGKSALYLVDIILVREKSLESLEILGCQLEVRVT